MLLRPGLYAESRQDMPGSGFILLVAFISLVQVVGFALLTIGVTGEIVRNQDELTRTKRDVRREKAAERARPEDW